MSADVPIQRQSVGVLAHRCCGAPGRAPRLPCIAVRACARRIAARCWRGIPRSEGRFKQRLGYRVDRSPRPLAWNRPVTARCAGVECRLSL